jgi:hypothetical protein
MTFEAHLTFSDYARAQWAVVRENNTHSQRGFTVGASLPLCFLRKPALALLVCLSVRGAAAPKPAMTESMIGFHVRS